MIIRLSLETNTIMETNLLSLWNVELIHQTCLSHFEIHLSLDILRFMSSQE
jgi:hypothetical protein